MSMRELVPFHALPQTLLQVWQVHKEQEIAFLLCIIYYARSNTFLLLKVANLLHYVSNIFTGQLFSFMGFLCVQAIFFFHDLSIHS